MCIRDSTRLVGSLFHVINDLERVGDLSINVLDAAKVRVQEEIKFSSKAVSELEELSRLVTEQLDNALEMFRTQSDDAARIDAIEATEQQIDDMVDALRTHHLDRLKNRKCSAKNGMLYMDLLTNLERIADHAENVATSVDHETPMGLWE